MELDFYQELILSAVFSVLFAFLIGNIAGAGSDDGNRAVDDAVSCDLKGSASVEEEWGRSVEEEAEVVPEREISGGDGGGEEKSAKEDEVGVEEGTAHEMFEAVDIGINRALIFKEEEEKVCEKDTERSYSKAKDVSGEGVGIMGGVEGGVDNKEGSLLHGEEDWEGIERSELEKLFGAAMEYVGTPSGAAALARLSSDKQMELYGLRKVATEGPCYESQPFPLKVSAWARWQAWQKLSSMTPEVAMEQYISLLSKSMPGWMVDNSRDQLNSGSHRELEDPTSIETETASGGLKRQGVTGTFRSLFFPPSGALLSLYW